MNTKKIISALLVTSVMLFTACSSSDSRTKKNSNDRNSHKKDTDITVLTDDDMPDMASDVIDVICEISNDDDYLSLMTSPADLQEVFDIVEDIEIDEDEDIYVVDFSGDELENYIENQYDNYDDLSDNVKYIISTRTNSMISNLTNARLGSVYLVATGILQYSRNYIATDIDNQMWIIPTDSDEVCIYVSFFNSGENIVTVIGGYIFIADDIEDTIDDISDMFDVESRSIQW